MLTDTLIHSLILRGDYEQLRGSHHILRQAAAALQEDDRHLLNVLLDYAERYSRYPTYVELEAYIVHSPYMDGRIDGSMMGMRCKELTENPSLIPVHNGSMAQILDDYTYAGREAWYVQGFKSALSIVAGGLQGDNKKEKDLKGPEDAMAYLRDWVAKDFTLPPSSPEGPWKQNAELSADALIAGLRDTLKDRTYTGFKHTDADVTIGPNQVIRFVGVLGYSNHGKSLVTRTMAYNMAASGKIVLYIALEGGNALNTWTQLSFLHAHARPDLDIPPAHVWKHHPKRITDAHRDNLHVLIEDLQHGKSVPGEIVVKTLDKWPDIVRELEIGHNGKPYDALIIDYIAHLKTGATRGDREHDEIRAIFKAAQGLTQSYKGGRGLVVVTPLQANKEGMKKADEAEGEDWGVLSDTAVNFYTDALRDMDLVISVWNKDPLKHQGMLKLSCVKSREAFFEPHFVSVDPRTFKVHDLPGGPKSDPYLIRAYREEMTEAALTPEDLQAY